MLVIVMPSVIMVKFTIMSVIMLLVIALIAQYTNA